MCSPCCHRTWNLGFGSGVRRLGCQALLDRARPDFLKLDVSLVRDIHENLIKQELIASLIRVAARVGASVIGEGVETHLEAQTLIDAGAQFGQGHLFAKPARPETIVVAARPGQEH